MIFKLVDKRRMLQLQEAKILTIRWSAKISQTAPSFRVSGFLIIVNSYDMNKSRSACIEVFLQYKPISPPALRRVSDGHVNLQIITGWKSVKIGAILWSRTFAGAWRNLTWH